MFRKLLILCATLVLGSTIAHGQETVRLMANTSPPYADRQLPEQGLALELVKHIYSRTPYTPEITIETWSRAMEGVRLGVYDALATAWHTPEREKDFLFSDPYLSSKLILVKLRDAPGDYYELQHLAGKRLGVRVDYGYGVDFSAVPDLQLVQENHLIQLLLKLLSGSLDFVIGDQRTMALQINEYLGSQALKFEVVEIELPARNRHIAATRSGKGEEKMIAAFNKALAQVRKDGSLDEIITRWDKLYSIPD
jgi:polar amino acid transport system substrate-binding protein